MASDPPGGRSPTDPGSAKGGIPPHHPIDRFPVVLPLSSEHYRAIGMVAAYWSCLEAELERLIQALAGIDLRRGAALTTHIPFRVRLDIILSLGQHPPVNQQFRDRLSAVISGVRALETKRNQIIHATWAGIDPSGKEVSRHHITARGTVKFSGERMTAEDIENVASSIAKLTVDLVRWQMDLFD